MRNLISKSPLVLAETDLWADIPDRPPTRGAAGKAGNVFCSSEHNYGLVHTENDDYVFCWFDGGERRDTELRTQNRIQTPPLDASSRALVIASNGESLCAADPNGSVTRIGTIASGRFSFATWLSFGFAAIGSPPTRGYGSQAEWLLSIYQRPCDWSDGQVGHVTSFPVPGGSILSSVGTDVLAVCAADDVQIIHVDEHGDARILGKFGLENYQGSAIYTEETTWQSNGPFISNGYEFQRVERIDEAIATRSSLIMLVGAGQEHHACGDELCELAMSA